MSENLGGGGFFDSHCSFWTQQLDNQYPHTETHNINDRLHCICVCTYSPDTVLLNSTTLFSVRTIEKPYWSGRYETFAQPVIYTIHSHQFLSSWRMSHNYSSCLRLWHIGGRLVLHSLLTICLLTLYDKWSKENFHLQKHGKNWKWCPQQDSFS